MSPTVILSTVLLALQLASGGVDLDRMIHAAQEATENLEYQDAGDLLLTVIASPSATPNQMLRAQELNGVVQRILGHDVEARGAFLWVLERAPAWRPPAGTAPKIVSFFELVRAEAEQLRQKSASTTDLKPVTATPKQGVLLFRSDPPGLPVSVDGVDSGITPTSTTTAMGRHSVIISSPTGPLHFDAPVVERQNTTVRASLFVEQHDLEAERQRNLWRVPKLVGGAVGALIAVPTACCFASSLWLSFDSIRSVSFDPTFVFAVSLPTGLCTAASGGGGGYLLYDALVPPPVLLAHVVKIQPADGSAPEEHVFPTTATPMKHSVTGEEMAH